MACRDGAYTYLSQPVTTVGWDIRPIFELSKPGWNSEFSPPPQSSHFFRIADGQQEIDLCFYQIYQHELKRQQHRPVFELLSPIPFPTIIIDRLSF